MFNHFYSRHLASGMKYFTMQELCIAKQGVAHISQTVGFFFRGQNHRKQCTQLEPASVLPREMTLFLAYIG